MSSLRVWLLSGLVLLCPFEYPSPILRLFGLELTVLELVGALVLGVLAVDLVREGELVTLGRSPFLAAAAAFVVVCFLSSAFAGPPRELPFKFSLRVATGAFAFALASFGLRKHGAVARLLDCLAIAGTVVAVVGLAEMAGVPGFERLASAFRPQDFEVGGQERLSATFSYPNLAAGFMVIGLAAALMGGARTSLSKLARSLFFAAFAVIFLAILLTYSRGALLGALVVPLALYAWARSFHRPEVGRRAVWSIVAVVVLGLFVTLLSPAFRLRAFSEGDSSWYSADYVTEVGEISLQPGELARVPVKVRNTGRNTWEPEGRKSFHLSYHWYDVQSKRVLPLEGERTALPHEIRPGTEVELKTYVRAPKAEGFYLLVWDMVQEHTTWFVGKGGAGKFMSVVVGAPPPLAAASVTPRDVARRIAEDSWFPGRLELWSIAVKLFLDNPILGVGPDNFRWLYGPAAGHARWDSRVFSNSLYLETLATTGLLGGITFFGLYTAASLALFGVVRQYAESDTETSLIAAAVLTALIAFAVHGLFDYLLESTSVYLPFWVLLGGASALVAEARANVARGERVIHHACWV